MHGDGARDATAFAVAEDHDTAVGAEPGAPLIVLGHRPHLWIHQAIGRAETHEAITLEDIQSAIVRPHQQVAFAVAGDRADEGAVQSVRLAETADALGTDQGCSAIEGAYPNAPIVVLTETDHGTAGETVCW